MSITRIHDDLSLSPIQTSDQDQLFELMTRIYLPEYQHLWSDNGCHYLHAHYSAANLDLELKEPGSRYFFVLHKNLHVGILRVVLDMDQDGNPLPGCVKLHRIYLDSAVQGKGIGQQLIQWIQQEYCRPGYELWLEVMDTQEHVIQFYKKSGFKVVGNFNYRSTIMYEQFRGMLVMSKIC